MSEQESKPTWVRRIERLEDGYNGTMTYELSDGRWVTLDARAVRRYGLRALMDAHGIRMPDNLPRVDVFQSGRKIGSVPGAFDPLLIQSTNWLYDVRPGDFVRVGDHWVAARMLGPGDLEAVPGFVWSRADATPPAHGERRQ